jgi:hypothetical protein
MSRAASTALVALLGTVVPLPAFALLPPRPSCTILPGSDSVAYVLTGDRNQFVYDCANDVFWLADANLAANPNAVSLIDPTGKFAACKNPDGSVSPCIDADGAMSFDSAWEWVALMNKAGYEGVDNWQLPATAAHDPLCANATPAGYGKSGNTFGYYCSSALAAIYNYNFYACAFNPDGCVADGSTVGGDFFYVLPGDSAVWLEPGFPNAQSPFINLWPASYWSGQPARDNGNQSFSFANGIDDAHTPENYLHVLPVLTGAIDTPPTTSKKDPPTVYTGGHAAGQAIYDPKTNRTWPLDANLAATQEFKLSGYVDGVPSSPWATDPYQAPKIAPDGAMNVDTAEKWIKRMNGLNNQKGYLYAKVANIHHHEWRLPKQSELQQLYIDLGYPPNGGQSVHPVRRASGPFQNLQPSLYWSCQVTPAPGKLQPPMTYPAQLPCLPLTYNTNTPPQLVQPNAPGTDADPDMEWSFNFGDGYVDTTNVSKLLYVMVYAVPN